MPADEQVADTDWIKEAAKHGWPILMKDKWIRHRQAEITAVTGLPKVVSTLRPISRSIFQLISP